MPTCIGKATSLVARKSGNEVSVWKFGNQTGYNLCVLSAASFPG